MYNIYKMNRMIADLGRRVNRIESQHKAEAKHPLYCSCDWKPKPGTVYHCDDIRIGPWYCPNCKRVIKNFLSKLPEPECEHGARRYGFHNVKYTDKHCRDCGKNLQE